MFAVLFAGYALTFGAGCLIGNALLFCQPISLSLGNLCTFGLKLGLMLALRLKACLLSGALGLKDGLLPQLLKARFFGLARFLGQADGLKLGLTCGLFLA